ncbi:MAG: hypothetical protein ACK5YS_03525 [bacterium]|jgi:hypothetical protein
MQFISQIIRSNFLFYDDAIHIRSSYLDLFFNSENLETEKIEHKGRIYFQLDALPKTCREVIEIPGESLIYQELYKVDPNIKNPYVVRYINSLKNSFLEVIRDCEPFLYTYSDYKLDSKAMKRKALTHGIMHFAGPFLKKFPERYDAVFEILKNLNPDIELPLNSIKEFYIKSDEIIRAGLPHGLIKDLPAPLDTS